MRFIAALVALAWLVPAVSGAQAPATPVTAAQIAEGCEGNGPAMQPPRMNPIPAEKMSEAQKQAAVEFGKVRGSDRGVFGPYVALLRSPEVLVHTVRLGNYLQFQSALPQALQQFTIAITARQWSMQYMWNVHCQAALRAGVKPFVTQALLKGRRPTGMTDDETLVYDVIDELHRNQSVSDETYAKAVNRFGEQGVVDLIGINAYYTFLSMVGNTARLPVGQGTKPNLPGFPY